MTFIDNATYKKFDSMDEALLAGDFESMAGETGGAVYVRYSNNATPLDTPNTANAPNITFEELVAKGSDYISEFKNKHVDKYRTLYFKEFGHYPDLGDNKHIANSNTNNKDNKEQPSNILLNYNTLPNTFEELVARGEDYYEAFKAKCNEEFKILYLNEFGFEPQEQPSNILLNYNDLPNTFEELVAKGEDYYETFKAKCNEEFKILYLNEFGFEPQI